MAKSFRLLFAWSLWVTLTLGAAVSKRPSVSWIVPGAVWYDTDGVKIDAHGGQVWQHRDKFYWIGSSYNDSYQPRIYTSIDLMNWVNRGVQYPVTHMFRPKMLRPKKLNGTSLYYILGQVSNAAQQLYSKTITGGYSKGLSYLLPPHSYNYTDEGVFEDDDGSWYFLASARSNTLQINYINGNGSIGSRVMAISPLAMEAPGMFKADGVYYLILSAKTGYSPNPNKVYWSTSLAGPWTGPADIAPEAENTYGSQNSYELVIKGSSTTSYLYLGDAWAVNGTAASNYMWLPLTVDTSSHNVTLQYEPMWRVDIRTGEIRVPRPGKRYEAEQAQISGRAAVAECVHCISKRAVQHIDTSSLVIFRDVNGTGGAQWVSFHYTTNQNNAGAAHVYVNDDKVPRKISDHNIRAGYHKTTPIHLTLKAGPVNTLKFGCSGPKDFEIHLDGIEMHEE